MSLGLDMNAEYADKLIGGIIRIAQHIDQLNQVLQAVVEELDNINTNVNDMSSRLAALSSTVERHVLK